MARYDGYRSPGAIASIFERGFFALFFTDREPVFGPTIHGRDSDEVFSGILGFENNGIEFGEGPDQFAVGP